MLALITAPGNLLIHYIEGKKKRFIYINPEGDYLAASFEVRTGHPINEMEWNNLKSKSKQKPRGATEIELMQAKNAAIKRAELLKISTMADRMIWVDENCPKKTTEEHKAA